MHRRLTDGLGIGYLAVSMGLSCYCLYLIAPYMANDFFWRDFDFATVSPALAAAFHTQRSRNASRHNLDVMALANALPLAPYEARGNTRVYTRMLLYDKLTTVQDGINGLRHLETSLVTNLMTTYCWVDFQQRWGLAHSAVRQERCANRYAANGAVYLEATLRNIQLHDWLALNGARFDFAIADAVAASTDGQRWLSSLMAHEWVSVQDEVDLWTSFHVTRYELQYTNRVAMGIQKTVDVTNAMGQVRSLVIKSSPTRVREAGWTTGNLVGTFEYELQALGVNQSLVRNATTFFGVRDPMLMVAYNYGLPLPYEVSVLQDALGLFFATELRWLPPPVTLVTAVQRFRTAVFTAMLANNASVFTAISAVAPMALAPTPVIWSDPSIAFHTGNPFCLFGKPLPFVQQTFSFDEVCDSQSPLTIEWSAFNSLFATLALRQKLSPIDDLCQRCPPSEVNACVSQRQRTQAAFDLIDFGDIVIPDITSLNLSYWQLLAPVSYLSGQLSVSQNLLLAPDWAFFGWMSVYDWVMHTKEVVAFEGDVATWHIMSSAYASKPTPAPSSMSSSLAIYIWYGAAATSAGLLAIALVVITLWLVYRPCNCDWLVFNRIAGSTWLSRSLLVLRGVTAALCLASVPLAATTRLGVVAFQEVPRSVEVSALLAGEATWLAYATQELLHPMTQSRTRLSARVSTAMSWLLVLLLDILAPLHATASMDQKCYTVNMANFVFCNSGTLLLGHWTRTLVVLGVNVGGAMVVAVAATLVAAPRPPSLPASSALWTGLSTCFLNSEAGTTNPVTAFMGGLLYSHRGVFDVTRWLSLDLGPARLMVDVVHVASRGTRVIAQPSSRAHYTLLLLGLGYTGFTLSGNVAFLSIIRESLANDFFWSGFNSSSTHAYLATKLNELLLTTTEGPLHLDDPRLLDYSRFYNGSEGTIVWSNTAARRALFQSTTSLEIAVANLRRMDPCNLPWMFTQYCWLDLNQTWEMASTHGRQRRCVADMTTNGAVYLELPLRNVNDWDAWDRCWGTSFEIGFGKDLSTTLGGRQWLASLTDTTLPIDHETRWWRRHNISHFTVQWQNYKTVGLNDALTIETALGLSYPLALSDIPASMHTKHQTSYKMYWTFASDLWAIDANTTSIGGRSLLRTSVNFAFRNVSNWGLLVENRTLASPFTSEIASLESSLGPFNAIDMVYLLPPPSLLDFYASVSSALSSLLLRDPNAQSTFLSLPVKYNLVAAPRFLLDDLSILLGGGNLFCGIDNGLLSGATGLYSLFTATSPCRFISSEVMFPSRLQLLFALLGFDVTLALDTTSDFSRICALDTTVVANCAGNYATFYNFSLQYAEDFVSLERIAKSLYTDVIAHNISMVQYAVGGPFGPGSLLLVPLLDDKDRGWSFYGWCSLYEWAIGMREVVSFQGDAGTITTISGGTAPDAMAPDAAQLRTSYAALLQHSVAYVTTVIILIMGLVFLNALRSRGRLESRNLFCINRVVGLVWLGRPFLLLRSVTALCLLNTSVADLVQVGAATRFALPELPWYKTILGASEVTWFVYVLNDLFSCATHHYTSLYAFKSSNLAWLVLICVTFIQPLAPIGKLQRSCDARDMDAALVCTSGFVAIGSYARLQATVAIAFGCVLISYAVERWRVPRLSSALPKTLLLNAQSLYMLSWTHWRQGDDYFLDTSSGIMAGLLSLQHKDTWYIFDTKTWRLLLLPIAHDCGRFKHAIPLSKF